MCSEASFGKVFLQEDNCSSRECLLLTNLKFQFQCIKDLLNGVMMGIHKEELKDQR